MQVLRKLLFPFSLVYALIVFLRNRCYNYGWFSSKSFATKTICVGNLSVGGTGKTPMIEMLVRMFGDTYTIAVLSRGYKRKSKGFLLATDRTTVEDLGDEPFQLKTKYPSISVAVDEDRRNGIAQLERSIAPDVILLDDAFQHRKVTPDFSILLTAYNELFVDDWYLPTGNLRDGKSEARRADVIVVTKCPPSLTAGERNEIKSKIKALEHQSVLFTTLAYNAELKGNGVNKSLESLKNKKVTLVTGIANPYPLVLFLREKGVSFDHLKFNDHHFFTEKELAALKKKACILTTEKDYVRLNNALLELNYIEIAHKFLADDEHTFKEELSHFMTSDS